MLPKWCSAARPGPVGRRRGRRRARLSAITLVEDEVVHPIRRHYTRSDRVQRDGTGAARRNGCSATEWVQRCVTSAVRIASSAHRTRVREPELRASTAQQSFAGGKQTGEGPKPCGLDPSSCRISAVISPRERYDDRRVHQLRGAPNDGSAMPQP